MVNVLRILDWFWLSSRAGALRASATRTARAENLAKRARISYAVARQALAPTEPYEDGSPDAVACELFRQSIHWSLEARRELSSSGDSQPTPFPSDSEDNLRFAREIVARSFEDIAEQVEQEHAEQEQAGLVEKLDRCSQALLEPLPNTRRESQRLWTARLLRIVTSLLVIAVVAFAVSFISDWLEDRRDLAPGKAWKVSSSDQATPCTSPAQDCAGASKFFFHTQEQESPSIEFDLGEVKTISTVVVENRTDCCETRAVPLIVDVSERPGEWQEVGRRMKDFGTWRAQFPPTRARWVRLSVPKRTYLHLARVKILP
jgi:hypothetical protein